MNFIFSSSCIEPIVGNAFKFSMVIVISRFDQIRSSRTVRLQPYYGL